MKNQINTSEGNVQLIGTDGKMINVHPSHVYAAFNVDTVSFLLIAMPKSSGLAVFTSTAEDLLVNGQSYSFEELKTVIPEEFAEAGAQARCEIVDELPETGKTNTIYLVPKPSGETGYDEYIYIKETQTWELVGDTSIEMENYLLKTDFYTYSAATEVTINALSGAISDEASRAISAESALSDSIDALNLYIDEVSGITDTLDGDIDILEESLAQEASARTDADTVLSGAISSVTEDVAALSGDVTAHTSNTDIHVTAADKTAWADKYTQAEVDGIVSGLNDSIDAVSGAVADEVSARTAADEALGGLVDTVSGDLNTHVSNADIHVTVEDKANWDDKYTKSETDEAIEAAVSGKADADDVYYKDEIDAAFSAVNDTVSAHTANTNIHVTSTDKTAWDAKAEVSDITNAINGLSGAVDTALLGYINDAEYVSSAKTINFLNGNTLIAQIDATDFIKDGMVDTVAISGGNLVITFNTDSGKEAIELPLTQIFDPSNYYTKAEVDAEISAATSGKADSADLAGYTTTATTDALNTVVTAHTANTDVHVTTGDKATWNAKLDSSAISDMATQTWVGQQGYLTQHQDISGKQDVSGMTAYTTTATTDALNTVVTAHTGNSDIHVTVVDKQTWSAKQDALVSGTNIKTINNESILGEGNIDIQGGGKAIEAGRGISITTGETADTINCTLPIYNAGTSNLKYGSDNNTLKRDTNSSYNSIFGVNNTIDKYGSNFNFKCYFNTIFGEGNKLFVDNGTKGLTYNFICGYQNSLSSNTETINSSFAIGLNNKGYRSHQALIGWYNQATNIKEVSIGIYNNSVSGSSTFGDSGNTLFSVGNGTADNARHNAFEIRQNGDIYITLDGQDVKLQDNLGGGSITIDPSLDSGSTNPVANSAITTAINAKADTATTYTKSEVDTSLANKADTSAVTAIQDSLSGYTTTGDTNALSGTVTAHTADTTVHVTSADKTAWNGAVTASTANTTALGGLSLVKLSQSEYDDLVTKDSNTLYVIND